MTGTGPKPSSPTSTGGATNGDSDNSNDSGSDNNNSEGESDGGDSKNQTATIAASVLGGVVAIALVGGGYWFWRRRQNKKNGQPLGPAHGNDNPPGTPELGGTQKAGGYYGSKELSPQFTSASPVHGAELPTGAQTSPPTELPSQQQIPRELAAGGGFEYSQQQQQQHQAWTQHQQHPQSSSVSPMTPPDNQGMGWQSGPVQSYELDSNMRR
jgi:hypothetical protein